MPALYEHTGVIHLCSAYSYDGRTPVPDILKTVWMNRLDFIMRTDHSDVQAREEGIKGWHGDTLLIVGQEIAPQTYIDHVRKQAGIGFIAHLVHEGIKNVSRETFPLVKLGGNRIHGPRDREGSLQG